ncbi:hypothetical protein QQF64_032572 [Cirrhinus molitorella]|uniref:Uncharacterized protein n=1 Tax=Cirrhinus molitorella TaxID=172907 RepID=A0ABR3N075_9TELE
MDPIQGLTLTYFSTITLLLCKCCFSTVQSIRFSVCLFDPKYEVHPRPLGPFESLPPVKNYSRITSISISIAPLCIFYSVFEAPLHAEATPPSLLPVTLSLTNGNVGPGRFANGTQGAGHRSIP